MTLDRYHAAVDPDAGWAPDLVAWADVWVAAQLDEEERLAYEQAYAEYEAREQERYYSEQAMVQWQYERNMETIRWEPWR